MLPLVPLYLAGAALRWAGSKPQRLAHPVLSIGNLSAGGTGKTPFVIALAKLIGSHNSQSSQGISVDVLSRGYGRTNAGAERVDPEGSAEQFGDEPLLIARQAHIPVFVAAKRFEAGELAEQGAKAQLHLAKAQLHLLDDGFQHRQLYRDIDVVLIDSEDLGDRVLPGGNLREPLSALKRASVFAVPVEDNAAATRLRELGFTQPIWRFRREMTVPKIAGPVVAFCGIARPDQFFAGLEIAGITLAGRQIFRDHHRFAAQDGELLARLVRHTGAAALVTTEKDHIRFDKAKLSQLEAASGVPLLTAGLRVVLEDEPAILEWLQNRLEL